MFTTTTRVWWCSVPVPLSALCARPRGLDKTVHRKVVMSSLCKRLCFALVKPATLPSDANKHTGHNRRIPGTDEDVNIESMICLICVRVWWFQGGVGGGG